MIDIDSKINQIAEVLKNRVDLTQKEVDTIKDAICEINQSNPSDIPSIFNKSNTIIRVQENLSFVSYRIKQGKAKIFSDYKGARDKHITKLVALNRPSFAAIESEVRCIKPEVSDMEYTLEVLDNILAYIEFLQLKLDSYLWSLKGMRES